MNHLGESIQQAITDWYDNIYNNKEAQELLEDETWYGVCIGFFVGKGFTCDEAYQIITQHKVKY